MPALRIPPAAYEDILNIADHRIREVGPNSAEAITNRLLDTIDLLEETPLIGPLHHDPALPVSYTHLTLPTICSV